MSCPQTSKTLKNGSPKCDLGEVRSCKRQLCDLCGEFVPAACICRMDGLLDLCPECFQHMAMMPEGRVKSSIKRILIDNVL